MVASGVPHGWRPIAGDSASIERYDLVLGRAEVIVDEELRHALAAASELGGTLAVPCTSPADGWHRGVRALYGRVPHVPLERGAPVLLPAPVPVPVPASAIVPGTVLGVCAAASGYVWVGWHDGAGWDVVAIAASACVLDCSDPRAATWVSTSA